MLKCLEYSPSNISSFKVYITKRNEVKRFFEEIKPKTHCSFCRIWETRRYSSGQRGCAVNALPSGSAGSNPARRIKTKERGAKASRDFCFIARGRIRTGKGVGETEVSPWWKYWNREVSKRTQHLWQKVLGSSEIPARRIKTKERGAKASRDFCFIARTGFESRRRWNAFEWIQEYRTSIGRAWSQNSQKNWQTEKVFSCKDFIHRLL